MFTKTLFHRDFTVYFLVFLSFILYIFRFAAGAEFNGSIIGSTWSWGSLTENLLIQNPVLAIWNMHSQPPLVNSIYAIAYLFYPNQLIFLQALWFIFTTLIPILLFKSLRLVNLPYKFAFALSCLYCFYPNTLGYAFSGYNTIVVQFSFAFFVYSLVKLVVSRVRTIIPFCISSAVLFLVRAPFLGVALILMLLIVYSINFKRYKFVPGCFIAAALSIALIMVFQFHYIKDFNQLTSSSLGGFSTLRLLKVGLDNHDYSKLQTNDCETMLLKEADSGDSIKEFPSCQNKALLLRINLDEISEYGNSINSLGSLQVAILARDLALKVLKEHPFSLVNAVFGRDNQLGSLDYFLSVKTLGDRPLRQFIDNFPFFASLLALLYILFRKIASVLFKVNFKSETNLERSISIILVGLLFAFTVFYSLATEILENDRYKHEAYPIYFFLLGTIVSQVFSSRRELNVDQ